MKRILLTTILWYILLSTGVFAAVDVFEGQAISNTGRIEDQIVSNLEKIEDQFLSVTGDPCLAMGASGDYVGWWNGEFPGDNTKGCFYSGSEIQSGTPSPPSVINSVAPISGNYDAIIQADNEHITWPYTANANLITAGTIQCDVKTPTSFAAADAVVGIVHLNSQNYAAIYTTDDNGRLYGRYVGGNTVAISLYQPMSPNTVHTVYYSWRTTSTNVHAVCVEPGSNCSPGHSDWTRKFQTLPDMVNTPDKFSIGEALNIVPHEGTWQIDNCIIREGYEGD